MLRKTQYNRNSMKRSTESKFSLPQDDSINNNSGTNILFFDLIVS